MVGIVRRLGCGLLSPAGPSAATPDTLVGPTADEKIRTGTLSDGQCRSLTYAGDLPPVVAEADDPA